MKPDACAKHKKMVLYFWRFRPGYFMYVGPGCEEVWNFGRYPDSPSGHLDQLASSTVEVYEQCEFPIIAGIHNFLQRELTHGGQNMNFTAGVARRDMLVTLILSANDISMLHCIC